MNPEALFKLINVVEKPVGGSSPEEAIHPSASQPQREAYQVEPLGDRGEAVQQELNLGFDCVDCTVMKERPWETLVPAARVDRPVGGLLTDRC
jgi:hypothetical protein